MRGHPAWVKHPLIPGGSIPAHAGAPRWSPAPHRPHRVYPRACGGTWAGNLFAGLSVGLSPRMRGHLKLLKGLKKLFGSIPAHAGAPLRRLFPMIRIRVYPRACGGTPTSYTWHDPEKGLSPRMRGHRTEPPVSAPAVGSIPAHAGAPLRHFGTGQHQMSKNRPDPAKCNPFR